MLIAGIRMKGKYGDCSGGFSRLGKAIGRYICGKALCLYYEAEYREDDANLNLVFLFARKLRRTVFPSASCPAVVVFRWFIAGLTINWAEAMPKF